MVHHRSRLHDLDSMSSSYLATPTSTHHDSDMSNHTSSTDRRRRARLHPNHPRRPNPYFVMYPNTIQRIGRQGGPQEYKVKLTGLPRDCWTSDVHSALAPYGNIMKIEMQTRESEGVAWVIFRPCLSLSQISSLDITIKNIQVNVQPWISKIEQVASPVNPKKTYKEYYAFNADKLEFGVVVEDMAMGVMHSVNGSGPVQVVLDLKKGHVQITFCLKVGYDDRTYMFEMAISQLASIYNNLDETTGQRALIIPFHTPPKFFLQAKGDALQKSFSPSDRVWNGWTSWHRQTAVLDQDMEVRLKARPIMDHKGTAIVDIGYWTTYRLLLNSSTTTSAEFVSFCEALADYGCQVQQKPPFTVTKLTASPMWSLLHEEIFSTHPHLDPSPNLSASDFLTIDRLNLGFPIQYQLEVCLSNGWLNQFTITKTFVQRLAAMDPVQAIHTLEYVADKQKTYHNPMDIFAIDFEERRSKAVPSYCTLARAVTITPTRLHVATPIAETSNRILRKYSALAERFLRVKFSDEKTEGRICNLPFGRADELFDRVKRAMTEGIVVAGRYYEFLAFGNSQFRDNGAYFFSPGPDKCAEDIRKAMGTFDHIKIPAKWGARIGQCFSTTRRIHATKVQLLEIPDIERNGYVFSDGVGKISRLVASMAAQELRLQNSFDDPPSLYQFRLAGCKGVLALDPHLTRDYVCIRPSQYKFPAENEGLEIIRASAFASACFNRQLIIVLSTLGVPDHTFIIKQQEMVNYLERATQEEGVALEKLQRNIDFNQTTLTMASMILDGFMRSRDPFLMSLLQLWRAYNIKFLKEKARIVVDKGAFLLGCIDETASLLGHFNDPQSQPDTTREEKLATLPEIFLQVPDPAAKGQYNVIKGKCILARNPSLHPGDIRVVNAVDIPALRHLKNVVVLPQDGDRDLASMCSGGDLDGDDYLVMWDPDFLPRDINEPPMDFTAQKPEELDRPITTTDVVEFFVTYMKNDSLPKIALAHLAQADFNADGVRNEKCLQLASLHSQAVDYPKNGMPAIMTQDLKPRKYPHFMDNKYRAPHHIYRSNGILGKLFDQVKLVDFRPRYENTFDKRVLEAFPMDDELLAKAKEIKAAYDSSLRRLMAKHAVRTEFEAWSVFVLSHNQEARDYQFAEEFGRSVGVIKDEYRHICRAAAGALSVMDHARIAPFVAAMYAVTAGEMEAALEECRETREVAGRKAPVREITPENMPFMSFPWLFHSELGKIATGGSVARELPIQQGTAKKHTHKVAKFNQDSAIGDVETSDGVTHIGEPLRLFADRQHRRSDVQSGYDSTPISTYIDYAEGDDLDGEEIVAGKTKESALDRLAGI